LGDVIPGAIARDAVLVIAYAALVGLLAQIVIKLPFTPVPITGQTLGVLLGGMALGWRRALAGMGLYALVGLAAVPWFAEGRGGLGILSAPSFGYIVGFVAAAGVLGWLAERGLDRLPWTALLAMEIGNAIIYLFGVGWLAHALNIGLDRALQLGLVPFLVGDAIKAVIAAGLLPGAWLLAGRR
jgi:biotin transport system substrate-specific component